MDNEYVNKVLNHLSNKSQKQKIKYELEDHITMNEEFFEDIGYDSTSATAKANERMGDADVVGEQFNLIKTNKKLKCLLSIIFAIVPLAAAMLYYYWYHSIAGLLNGIESPTFLRYILYNCILIFAFANIVYAIKNARLINLVSGFISSFYIIFISCISFSKMYFFTNAIANLFYGLSNAKEFYYYDSYENSLFTSLDRPLQYILFYVAIIFIVLIFMFSLYYIIKTKLLKNNRVDFIIKQIVHIIAVLMLIVSATLFVGISANTLAIKDDVYNQTQNNLTAAAKDLVQNIDELSNADRNELSNYCKSICKEFNGNDYKYSQEYLSQKYSGLYMLSFDGSDEFEITINTATIDYIGNMVEFVDDNDIEKAYEFAQNNFETNNLDFPYPISGIVFTKWYDSYSNLDVDYKIIIDYNIRYSNNNDKKQMILCDYMFDIGSAEKTNYDIDDDLQEALVKELMANYYVEPNSNSKSFEASVDTTAMQNSKYFDYGNYFGSIDNVFLDVHNSSYNRTNDSFNITFSYFSYRYVMFSGVYDRIYYTSSSGLDNEVYEATITFDESNNPIIKIEEGGYSYYSEPNEDEIVADLNHKIANWEMYE